MILSSVTSPVSANDLTVQPSVGGMTQGDVSSWIEVTNTASYSVEIDSVTMVVSLLSGNITYTYYSGAYALQPGEVKSFSYLIDYDFPKSEVGSHPCSIIITGYGSNDLFGNIYIFNTTFPIQDDSQTSSSSDIVANGIFSSPLTMPLIILVILVIVVIVVFSAMKKKKKSSTNLPQQNVTVHPQQIASQDDYKFCPKCGKPFSGEHQFCPFCGYRKP